MPARKATALQSDITRAIKATKAAGLPVARVELAPDGRVIVYTTPDATGTDANPCDRLLP